MEILGIKDELALSPSLTVVVAVHGTSKNSKYAARWALEKFHQEKGILFKLLHVRRPILKVPTPLGHYPISQVRDDVAAAHREDVDSKTRKMLLPFQQMFTRNEVEVETLLIEADDVAEAITGEVSKLKNSKLVIGASSSSKFKWLNNTDTSSRISECTPSFCTVYVIKKGKVSSIRPSKFETEGSIQNEYSDENTSTRRSSSFDFSSETDGSGIVQASIASHSDFNGPSLAIQRFQALSAINQGHLKSRPVSTDITEYSYSQNANGRSDESRISSFRSLQVDIHSQDSGLASTPKVPNHSSSGSKADICFELEKVRIELRHAQGMYSVAQNETIDASRQLYSLSMRRAEEALKFLEIRSREEQARESARQEKEKHEVAKREAEFLREWAAREASERKEAEYRAARDAVEKEKLEKALGSPFEPYKKFTWEEIVSATSSFSNDLRIGMGAYGTVYKCTLNHVSAAVKVLHSKRGHSTKEFQQELDILSKIRHPHLLLLLGACPDHSCLVYEYMENGSLEERLLQNNDSLPIPWFRRYRIAWEIASALVFLHQSKPRPIIHRDLKPANILFDQNLVSKIGDVGLSTLLPSIDSSQSPLSNDSGIVGTLCYIDPEYQRSGLVSPKCDVYAFGMIILQLLTAKPALALAHKVETALENDRLMDILDSNAGIWPIEETEELAILGLRCVEIRQRDRPDLNTEVLPVLERLKDLGDEAAASAPPKDFLCPLLKEVMEDPCVAADGYTYERKAIEVWLKKNDQSPITNLPMRDKDLISDFSLLYSIREWKSEKRPQNIMF